MLPTPAGDDDRADAAILDLLLYDQHRHPWTDHEVAREIGDSIIVADALSRLERSGLIHRGAGLVFPTRTAHRAAQLMR